MSVVIPRLFDRDNVKSVAIIGAGITGLTLAFYLKKRGIPVVVYEASDRVGGVIRSVRKDGFLAEYGPNTLLETSPKIAQLVKDAGLLDRKLNPEPSAEARYVVRYQRPIEMPATVPGFLTTKLFSLKGKLAFMREPFLPPRRDGVEESIGQFVVRRFNREFLDQAIDALVAGIYAGDPEKLSLTHAFPKLKALEDNYGSMVRGQIFGARQRKKTGEVAKDRAPKFSFDEGLQVLPDALAKELGDSLRLNCSVSEVKKTGDRWQILFTRRVDTSSSNSTFPSGCVPLKPEGGHPASDSPTNSERAGELGASTVTVLKSDHDIIVYCGTAYKLAELKIVSDSTVDLSMFSEVRHPPVSSVVLGFRREDVRHPCDGFGMLIPKIEGFKILGTIFSSSLFPNRAPAGHITLTSYIGGERYPELARLPQEQLVDTVLADLAKLLGVTAKPVFVHTAFWPRAIPQYNVGYGKFRDLLSQTEEQCPGLLFAGHYRDGVSLSDSIVAGINMSSRIANMQL